MIHSYWFLSILLLGCSLFLLLPFGSSFIIIHTHHGRDQQQRRILLSQQHDRKRPNKKQSHLPAGLFDDVMNFFNEWNNRNNTSNTNTLDDDDNNTFLSSLEATSDTDTDNNNNNNNNPYSSSSPSPSSLILPMTTTFKQERSTCILNIPTQTIKPGGLRLFLWFHVLGLQNMPNPKTWKAVSEATTTANNDKVIELQFIEDGSATLLLTLNQETGISLYRVGDLPSTSYLIQESRVLESLLKELQVLANDETVRMEHRLLTVSKESVLTQAQESLAFS